MIDYRKLYSKYDKEDLINTCINLKEYKERLRKEVNKSYMICNEKDKEIERLNNIINDLLDRQNEALRYIGNHLSLDSRYKHGNGDEELILVRKILNKHTKELKGSDKE